MSNTRNSLRPKLVEPVHIEDEYETVVLVLRKDVHLKIIGKVTGRLYEFMKAGSAVEVDKRDADIMLTKQINKTCCGGISQPYFEIQEGVL